MQVYFYYIYLVQFFSLFFFSFNSPFLSLSNNSNITIKIKGQGKLNFFHADSAAPYAGESIDELFLDGIKQNETFNYIYTDINKEYTITLVWYTSVTSCAFMFNCNKYLKESDL